MADGPPEPPEPSRGAARPPLSRRNLPGAKRAVVIGAGSFGTAIAVLLSRGGLRTTLKTRTEEQAAVHVAARKNPTYMPGVELPRDLRIDPVSAGSQRADGV